MKITIRYDATKDRQQDGGWLHTNITDFIWSLDVNLKRHHECFCSGTVCNGLATIMTDATSEIIQMYIDAFRTAMGKDGCTITVMYSGVAA